MGQNELLATVTELRGLRNMAAELAEQIDYLEDKLNKLFVGDCKVTWTEYNTTRFDCKTFKAEHEDLYGQYAKITKAHRFSVS